MSSNACDQQTQSFDPQSPRSEWLYVALPDHPLYGRCVSIIRRRTTATTTHCLIEDPNHPTFCYQILERWLSAQPPPPTVPPSAAPRAIAVPLIALDRLVQLVWAKQVGHQTSTGHERTPASSCGAALESAPSGSQNTAQ